MKNQLDLNQMGLVEMNSNEMEEVVGGSLFGRIIGTVLAAVGAAFQVVGATTIAIQLDEAASWVAETI